MPLSLVLAGASPSPTPTLPVDVSKVTPGLLGSVTFVLLMVAAFVLFRSLRKQLGRVPESFDEPPVS